MPFSSETVNELATQCKISHEVVLRKYLNVGQIDWTTYKNMVDQWEKEFAEGRSKRKGGGDYYSTQKAYLGETYMNLAFARYFQGKIGIDTLADYFGMKVKNISPFEGLALGST